MCGHNFTHSRDERILSNTIWGEDRRGGCDFALFTGWCRQLKRHLQLQLRLWLCFLLLLLRRADCFVRLPTNLRARRAAVVRRIRPATADVNVQPLQRRIVTKESEEEMVSTQPVSHGYLGVYRCGDRAVHAGRLRKKFRYRPPTDCAPTNAFGSPSRASLGEIVSYRPEGSAHALPDDSALGGLPNKLQRGPPEIKRPAPTVARRVVLVLPWQVPGLGIVKSGPKIRLKGHGLKSQGFVIRYM